jgi:hypothetical protein
VPTPFLAAPLSDNQLRRVVARFGFILILLAVVGAGCLGGGSYAPSSSAPSVALAPTVGCAAAIVHHNPAPALARLAGIPPLIPWVEGGGGHITGSLYYYTPTLAQHSAAAIGTRGRAQGGRSIKILWWVRGSGSPTLTIAGRRTDAEGSFHQTVTGPSPGNNTTFPSVVTIPTTGCWTLDIQSGSASGSITFRARTLNP